jgi:hypothetical protein
MFDDRALLTIPLCERPLTLLEVTLQRAAKFLELRQSRVEIRDLVLEEVVHAPAPLHATAIGIADQSTNLLQRKPKGLGLPDEAKTLERCRCVHPKAAWCALRLWKQAQPLVIAQRVSREAASRSQFTNLIRCSLWRRHPYLSSGVSLDALQRQRDASHGRRDIAKATNATRIPDFAGAPAGLDVPPDAPDRIRTAAPFDLDPNAVLVLAEAVSHHPVAKWFLLPDGHS